MRLIGLMGARELAGGGGDAISGWMRGGEHGASNGRAKRSTAKHKGETEWNKNGTSGER